MQKTRNTTGKGAERTAGKTARAFRKNEPLHSSHGEKPETDLSPVEIAEAVAGIMATLSKRMKRSIADKDGYFTRLAVSIGALDCIMFGQSAFSKKLVEESDNFACAIKEVIGESGATKRETVEAIKKVLEKADMESMENTLESLKAALRKEPSSRHYDKF